MKTKSIKKRHWATVFYPESLPDDWMEQLQKSGIKFAVSPLHDKDIDANGEPKKPHYHTILVFEGPTTFNVVNTICSNLSQPIPQALESVRGAYRYFTHMDNPDKYQYSDCDIKIFNGFDIRDYVELTRTEVAKIIKELQELIIQADIYEYCDFLDYLMTCGEEYQDKYDVACNHTILFDRYITSRRHKKFGIKR